MELAQFIGNSVTFTLPLTWEGELFNPAGWSLLFTAKFRETDLDPAAAIQKVDGAGITISGTNALVEIVPADTQDLPAVTLVCDIKAQNLTTGAVRTVYHDRLRLNREVSRGTSTSVPVYTSQPPIAGGGGGLPTLTGTADPNGSSGVLGSISVDYAGYIESVGTSVIRITTEDQVNGVQYGEVSRPNGSFITSELVADLIAAYEAANPDSAYNLSALSVLLYVEQKIAATDITMNAFASVTSGTIIPGGGAESIVVPGESPSGAVPAAGLGQMYRQGEEPGPFVWWRWDGFTWAELLASANPLAIANLSDLRALPIPAPNTLATVANHTEEGDPGGGTWIFDPTFVGVASDQDWIDANPGADGVSVYFNIEPTVITQVDNDGTYVCPSVITDGSPGRWRRVESIENPSIVHANWFRVQNYRLSSDALDVSAFDSTAGIRAAVAAIPIRTHGRAPGVLSGLFAREGSMRLSGFYAHSDTIWMTNRMQISGDNLANSGLMLMANSAPTGGDAPEDQLWQVRLDPMPGVFRNDHFFVNVTELQVVGNPYANNIGSSGIWIDGVQNCFVENVWCTNHGRQSCITPTYLGQCEFAQTEYGPGLTLTAEGLSQLGQARCGQHNYTGLGTYVASNGKTYPAPSLLLHNIVGGNFPSLIFEYSPLDIILDGCLNIVIERVQANPAGRSGELGLPQICCLQVGDSDLGNIIKSFEFEALSEYPILFWNDSNRVNEFAQVGERFAGVDGQSSIRGITTADVPIPSFKQWAGYSGALFMNKGTTLESIVFHNTGTTSDLSVEIIGTAIHFTMKRVAGANVTTGADLALLIASTPAVRQELVYQPFFDMRMVQAVNDGDAFFILGATDTDSTLFTYEFELGANIYWGQFPNCPDRCGISRVISTNPWTFEIIKVPPARVVSADFTIVSNDISNTIYSDASTDILAAMYSHTSVRWLNHHSVKIVQRGAGKVAITQAEGFTILGATKTNGVGSYLLLTRTENLDVWTGTLVGAAGGGSGDALTSGTLAQFAATTSAELRGVLSDETGTGLAVFATSPTLVTPALGTPSSGNLANCTGFDMLSALSSAEVSVTGATTLTGSAFGKMHVCSGTSADYTVGLPAASGNAGKWIGLRMAAGLTKLVTIDGNASETIDGALARIMWAQESAILLCDGTGWTKVAGKSIPLVAEGRRVTTLSVPDATGTHIYLDEVIQESLAGRQVDSGRIYGLRPGNYSIVAFIGMELNSFTLGGYEAYCGAVLNSDTWPAFSAPGRAAVVPTGVSGSNTYSHPSVASSMPLAAGDYISLVGYQSTGQTMVTRTAVPFVFPYLRLTESAPW